MASSNLDWPPVSCDLVVMPAPRMLLHDGAGEAMCAVFPVIGNYQSCLRPPVGAAMSRWRKSLADRALR